MVDPREDEISAYFARSRELLARVADDTTFRALLLHAADQISHAMRHDGKLLIAGNGGSAADAQHIAAEFVSRFVFERRALPALALTTDTSALTAIGNDYAFTHVFSRQIEALGRRGDVFLAISTSGRSHNVIAALQAARERGITTIGFTGGARTPMGELCDILLAVPSEETALIQQVHLVAAHVICGRVEQDLCGSAERPAI
jgi:D-sedoheptulose 7-phosphate isomerase